tara:strand:- start:615 stop:1007 length:393 start_codon:yes stop_codon:yes gene_type:complete
MKKKLKKKSISKLKKDLDAVFSKYIRHKYAIDGLVACYTCGVVKPVKQMQNGHFQSRKHLSTRWDEDNCRVQCVGCNVFKYGESYIFGKKLEKEIDVEALIFKSRQLQKFNNVELQEMIIEYKTKLNKYE